jgi:integrase
MKAQLTDNVVKALTDPGFVWDESVPGFGVRVFDSGRRSYVLDYRIGGRQRRYTIGDTEDWKAVQARARAKDLKREIDAGGDPLADRAAVREAATVAELVAEYEAAHLPTLSEDWAAAQRSMLKRFVLPAWGKRAVADITDLDVARLLNEVAAGRARPRKRLEDIPRADNRRAAARRKTHPARPTPIVANRLGAVLSVLFGYAVRWKMRSDNPAEARPIREEIGRDNPMSPKQLDAFLDALAAHPDRTAADATALLLLTGARRSEVFAAGWSEFDFEQRVWTKAAARMKRRRIHAVPLSSAAIALLTTRRAKLEAAAREPDAPPVSRYVFEGRRPGQPLREVRKFWREVAAAAGLTEFGFTRHDLRHTFATVLASEGKAIQFVGALLHHASLKTTAKYAHLYVDPLREAAESVGERMAGRLRLVGGRDVEDPAA